MTAATTSTTAPVALPGSSIEPPCDLLPSGGTSRTATAIASALWVFVSGLLVYGIAETAIKAAALFG